MIILKMFRLTAWLAAIAFAPLLLAQASAVSAPARPTNLGAIKAACVIGDVSAVNQDTQDVVPLHNDDLLFQNFAVKTAASASIVLVFSNGATVRLGANTELVIGEFLQDPFADADGGEAALKEESVPSSTRLKLTRGELVGHVAKLHRDSSYNVDLPCGVAGIRGTTFRHAYQPGTNGGGQLSMATSEGDVVFTGSDGTEVTVPSEVEITTRVRRRGGFANFDRHPISPRSAAIIEHHAKVMAAQARRVSFRKVEVVPAKAPKPAIRRDPAAKRETVDDTKDIEREVQEREKAPPKPAPVPKPTPAPKVPTPPAKKK